MARQGGDQITEDMVPNTSGSLAGTTAGTVTYRR